MIRKLAADGLCFAPNEQTVMGPLPEMRPFRQKESLQKKIFSGSETIVRRSTRRIILLEFE